METSQPLSIESFSYSWLKNLKPSCEILDDSHRFSLDASDEAFFIEMDPKSPTSKRFFTASQKDFNFDVPISESSITLVHADELISNGFLVPCFLNPLKNMEGEYDASDSESDASPIPSHAQKNMRSSGKLRCSSFRWCRSFSKRMLKKYLEFIRPLCEKLQGGRSCNRREGGGDSSVAYSVDNWRRSCDSDSSIYEAVLHCKKSFGE